MQNTPNTVQVVDSVLQMSINSLFTEDQEPVSDTAADTSSQQAMATHLLPSVARSHALAQSSNTPSKQPKVGAYVDIITRYTSKSEPSSIYRCTGFRYLCYIKRPVTRRPFAHNIYRSAVFS